VRIPAQRPIPRAAQLRRFALAEKYNAVWLRAGDPAAADPSRIIDIAPYGKPGWGLVDGQYLHFAAGARHSGMVCYPGTMLVDIDSAATKPCSSVALSSSSAITSMTRLTHSMADACRASPRCSRCQCRAMSSRVATQTLFLRAMQIARVGVRRSHHIGFPAANQAASS
jgi:hypothetical protein